MRGILKECWLTVTLPLMDSVPARVRKWRLGDEVHGFQSGRVHRFSVMRADLTSDAPYVPPFLHNREGFTP